jgi:RNA polymerase sigma-70 factor (ECF subfamily)
MDEGVLRNGELLLTELQTNGEAAFEKIYNLYSAELIAFAAKRLESLAEVKDILHDVFVDLWTRRETLRITTSLRAYLYSMVRYKVIDHVRKNVRREYYTQMVRSLESRTDNSTLEQILYEDMTAIVESEIDKLPEKTREVFLMSRYQHKTVREIAEQMQVSEQTVKNQLSTALRRLRPALGGIITTMIMLFIRGLL